MKRLSFPIFTLFLLVVRAGCGGRQTVQKVHVPPRIDLKEHELIAVVGFDSSNRGELGPLATRRFIELARRDQGMVRIVEFASQEDALRSVGHSEWNTDAVRALGSEHGIRTLIAGDLTISDIKPQFQVSAMFRSGDVSARLDATLAVRMIETATGASIWSRTGNASREVGHVSVLGGGGFTFDADDPEQAYGDLVDALVGQVTRDFRATWERR
jgi:hypothetical protein